MSFLRALSSPFSQRVAAVRARHVAMPVARTPRELDAARKRRNSLGRRRAVRRRVRRGSRTRWSWNFLQKRRERPQISFSGVRVGWRLGSLGLVLLFGALLSYALTEPSFFVYSIELVDTDFIPGDEVYRASGIHGLNIFWVDPDEVAANIEIVPGVRHVTVEVDWPATVYVEVDEKEPVLLWRQGGEQVWVDGGGHTFPARQQLDWLLPVIVDDVESPLVHGALIPIDVVAGARQLKQLRPNIELLYYDVGQGLSYQDGRDWRGFFGTGNDMTMKLLVYETLIERLVTRGIWPKTISVVDPGNPFHRE